MKMKYMLHLAFMNLSRRKVRTIISILIMTAALTIFILTLSLSLSISSSFNKNLQNNVGCRTLFVEYDYKQYSEAQIIDTVSKYKHVAAVVPQGDLGQIITVSEYSGKFELPQAGSNNGEIIVKGGNKFTIPKVIAGRSFNEGEANVALIPEKFVPDSRTGLTKDIKNQSLFDGKSLIGKEITGKTETNKIYTFTVVGVYSSDASMDDANTCYIPYQDINAIYNAVKKQDDVNYPIIAVVDNYKNVQAVMNELYKSGMRSSVKLTQNTELPIYINFVGGGLSIVIFLAALINIILTTINSVKDRTQEIGMLKAIGYKNKLVVSMLNFEAILIGVIGFILSVMISAGGILFISRIIQDDSTGMHIAINPLAILLGLFAAIAVPTIASISASRRIIKIHPSIAMKE